MKKEHPNTSTHSSNTVTTREKAIEWAKKVKLQITNSGYEKYSHCLTQDDLIEEMYKDYLFQEEAMRWWEMLGNKDKDSLQRDYGFNKNYLGMLPDEITHIYKSEHAIEAVDTNVLNPDNLDWDLYPGNEAGAFDHLDEPDYSPSIKEESSNREEGFTAAKWYLIPTSFKPVGELRDIIIAEMDINVTNKLEQENKTLKEALLKIDAIAYRNYGWKVADDISNITKEALKQVTK